MKEQIKILIAAVVAGVLLAGCGFWAYFGQRVPLADQFPEGELYPVYLLGSGTTYVVDEQAAEDILAAVAAAEVRKGMPFDTSSGKAYTIWLGSAVHLSVWENGWVTVQEPVDGKADICYFAGGKEMYHSIQSIAGRLEVYYYLD